MPEAKFKVIHRRKLEPGKVYLDDRHPNLRVKVKANGRAYWLFRYRINGIDRELSLGPLRDVSAAQACKKAAEYRDLLRDGKDPKAERARQRNRNVPTFKECAERLIEAKRTEWRNAKHAAQWESTLKQYAFPVLGDMAVDAIETEHVLRVLEPIWTTKTETATRLRQRIESVLDWAAARRYRSGDNPARWKGHLDKLLAQPRKVRRVRHQPAMPYTELPAFMAALDQLNNSGARALAFLILTAGRTSEVRAATWAEIEGDVWTVPAERMKAHREHRVPLSEQAQAIVQQMPMMGAYVFPGMNPKKPLSNGTMLMLLRRMGMGRYVPHGFRSSFRDWAAEQTNFPRELAEAALAHTLRNSVEAAYQRGDLLERRRKLMQAWADFALPQTQADVLPIRGKRA